MARALLVLTGQDKQVTPSLLGGAATHSGNLAHGFSGRLNLRFVGRETRRDGRWTE